MKLLLEYLKPMRLYIALALTVKTAAISLAEPGAERKRTRLKAPATATPAPMLPLTSMMTV